MGPHDVEVADEIYILAGCPAPAVIRRAVVDEKEVRLFVGLCFLDWWMYGKAIRENLPWETLMLS